ncbi:MAG: DUF2231 domain-containing protein [Ilumatobacteraceae bacterium]|nr:hypothetical protein [Ilumatobacter sp.]MCB0984887.1 hypothetical protein [Ilumatobacter sp.]
MELSTLFGLPAHPLLVHIPVVLVPLAAVIAVVFAIRADWLDRFGWMLVAVSGVGAIGAVLAAGSGEELEHSVKRSAALADHAEMGDAARAVSLVFFLVVVAVVGLRWFARRRATAAEASSADNGFWGFVRSRAGAVLMAVLLVVSAGAATYTVVAAGHQGAKVTWEQNTTGG